MNKPIGSDLYRRSKCNDLTGNPDGPCGSCPTYPPTPVSEPILPRSALIDGLDREVCLARWMENRLAVEGRHHASPGTPPNTMTRMQRDVGRALWLERYGAQRGAELRAKVAADREAERCRVTYCEVDCDD